MPDATHASPVLLSPAWFEAIRRWVPPNPTARLALAVQFETGHADGARIVHHQRYDAHGTLVAWQPGPCPDPDLCITQRRASTAPAPEGGDDTYVLRDGVARDVLGLPLAGWHCEVAGIDDLVCRAQIVCGAGPDGFFQRVVESRGTALRTMSSAVAAIRDRSGRIGTGYDRRREVRINAPYGALLDWLHGGGLLGHLISDGYSVRGDLWRISALEGLIAAARPRHACAPDGVEVLRRYGAAHQQDLTRFILARCISLGREPVTHDGTGSATHHQPEGTTT